jgi:hypothetical protein
MRAESEYHPLGTLAYLRPRRSPGPVHRPVRAVHRNKPFTALAEQVMSTEPYACASRVFWVLDNGASHRNWPPPIGSAAPTRTPRWSTCRSTSPG